MKHEPENIVMLSSRNHHENEFMSPSAAELKKELATNQKQIRRLEELIVKKRQKLAEMSNSINRVLQKQLQVKFRQPSFLDVMRAAELQPKLKLQLDEITKLEKSAEQVKTELEQLRSQRDTSVSHQASALMNSSTQRQIELERLKKERDTLKSSNHLSEERKEEHDPYIEDVKHMTETVHTLRKELKDLQKKDASYDQQQMLLCAYSCEMEEKMDSYVIWRNQKEKIIDKKALEKEAKLVEAAVAEREELEKTSMEDINSKNKLARQCEAKNNELKRKLRQLQNSITRSELDATLQSRRASTERNHSTQNLKDTVQHIRKSSMPLNDKKKQSIPDKTVHRLGSIVETATSITVSDNDISNDPLARMKNLTVYAAKSGELLGLEATYTRNGEIIRGKKMASHTLSNYDEHSIDLENADSLAVVYDDTIIYAFKVVSPNGNRLVGVDHPGVVRMINLRQHNIIGAEAQIDFETNHDAVRLVGLILTAERKTVIKRHMTNPNTAGQVEEDIQISNQTDDLPKHSKSHSQRNIIHGGSLPKINVKQVIDHRLMGFQPNRRG